MSIYTFRTRVSYDDIDQGMNLTLRGAMNHMQEAAILHSSTCGYSIADIPQTHVIWMLVQWRARLVGNVQWNSPITVHTWPRSMERVTSVRNYELMDGDGNLIAIGESNWVLVNADTGRPTRITPEIIAAYDLTEKDVFQTTLPAITKEEGLEACRFCVSRRDIDTNHHVNNRVYLDYAREALPEQYADHAFPEISVRYHRQLLLGDSVVCRYRAENQSHIVDITGEDPAHLHATIVFYE